MLPEEYDYNPLPKGVELRKSFIHGFGIFAKRDYAKGEIIGISHFLEDSVGLIRNPFRGFINHSNRSNCELQEVEGTRMRCFQVVVKKNIYLNEEVTLNYSNSPLRNYWLDPTF